MQPPGPVPSGSEVWTLSAHCSLHCGNQSVTSDSLRNIEIKENNFYFVKLQWTNETYHIQTIYQNLCFGGVIENICQKRVMMIMAGWLPTVQWISGGGGECWDNVTVATELRCGLAVSPALTPHSVSRTSEHQNIRTPEHPTLDSAHCTGGNQGHHHEGMRNIVKAKAWKN